MRFREKLFRFMYGRNGADKLCYAVFVVYFVLSVVNTFVRFSPLNIILMLLPAYVIFRMLSKNISKRRAENQKFLSWWNKVEPHFKMIIARMKEMKTRSFHRCPNCKAMLRLPRKKGKHTVACPNCKHKFNIRIWF